MLFAYKALFALMRPTDCGITIPLNTSAGQMKGSKKIHKNTLTGQQGVNLIATTVNDMGFLWSPTGGASDAGIDGFIEIRNPETGDATNLIIQVQSKATLHNWDGETPTSFEFRCDDRDIDYWLQGNAPVILVVSKPKNQEAYWVSVKDYFSDLNRRKTKKVIFNRETQRFTSKCSDELVRLAAPKDSGLYLAPPPLEETLVSNLLPISRYAQKIFRADTHHRGHKSVWDSLGERKAQYGKAWFLTDKQIVSFHDLRAQPWKDECDQTTVEEFHSDEWAFSNDPIKKAEFIRLLKLALSHDLNSRWMNYYQPKNGNAVMYFAKTKNLEPREITWKRHKEATRTVFGPHHGKKDPSKVMYYRHLGFEPSFARFEGQWHLQITPTYHFTSDGKISSRYRDSYLKGIKRIEKHQAVRDNVEFLAAYLVDQDLFSGERLLTFSPLRRFVADFGIPEQDWVSRADDEEMASLGHQCETITFTLE
ncbi:MAG: DUF4365 domain-containing protein [Verrucomicrobiaceae bacterium]|nr:DUF4365 domain-containing protein [Verrucomicrobiaceae bacterium]